MKRLHLAFVLVLAAAPAGAAFRDLGAGARAPGMGNAFVAVADDQYAAHYNPAGLGVLERTQLGLAHTKLHTGLTDESGVGHTQLALARPLRAGTWGALSLSYFALNLDSVYSETVLGAAYGREIKTWESGSALYAGFGARRLSLAFTPPAEAYNATNGTLATGLEDPVLAGASGASAIGADVGLLYRGAKSFSLGLMVRNANAPKVGVATKLPVAREMRLGVGWKMLWMNLTAEYQKQEAADGGSESTAIVGVERDFPTLEHGGFTIRGGLGTGTGDFREVTGGLSYRLNRLQFDYAMNLPLGASSIGAMHHRVALGIRFGEPTPEQEYTESLVSQMQRVKTRAKVGLEYEEQDIDNPARLDRDDLRAVQGLMRSGRYRDAHAELLKVLVDNPRDETLLELARRIDATAAEFPELTYEQPWAKFARRGATAFVEGRNREATLLAGQAWSLERSRPALNAYVKRLENMTGLAAELAPEGTTLLRHKLELGRVAFVNRKQDEAIKHNRDALTIEPENLTARKSLGTNYYMKGQYYGAIKEWERALTLERDPKEQALLRRYIANADQARVSGLRKAEVEGEVAKPALKPRKPEPRRAGSSTGPREIQRLYMRGSQLFVQGKLDDAEKMFQRILQIDPTNKRAQRALERLRQRR